MRWFCFLFSVFFLRVYRAQCTALRSNQKVISAASDALEEKPHEPFDEEKADKEDEEETEEEREAEAEAEEMDYSLATKNLETEINHREQLHAEEVKAEHEAEEAVKKIEAKPPACSVQKKGNLMVARDPLDVLSVDSFAATMAKRHFLVHYPDHPEAPFLKLPIIEIQTPLETLRRSRRCFRLYHKGSPRLFCAETTEERDDWMKDIYKAIFCINTGVQGAGAPEAEAAATEAGKQIQLPARSTKVERWTAEQTQMKEKMLQEAEGGERAGQPEENPKNVPEVEISAGQFGQPPKVSVNGEEIAVPTVATHEDRMNADSMEG